MFPIHDGSLPLDPIAEGTLYADILEKAVNLPGFMERYDVFQLFERAAERSGARDIASMRLTGGTSGGPQAQRSIPAQLPQPPQGGIGNVANIFGRNGR